MNDLDLEDVGLEKYEFYNARREIIDARLADVARLRDIVPDDDEFIVFGKLLQDAGDMPIRLDDKILIADWVYKVYITALTPSDDEIINRALDNKFRDRP